VGFSGITDVKYKGQAIDSHGLPKKNTLALDAVDIKTVRRVEGVVYNSPASLPAEAPEVWPPITFSVR
jgi:hypothetical protein